MHHRSDRSRLKHNNYCSYSALLILSYILGGHYILNYYSVVDLSTTQKLIRAKSDLAE